MKILYFDTEKIEKWNHGNSWVLFLPASCWYQISKEKEKNACRQKIIQIDFLQLYIRYALYSLLSCMYKEVIWTSPFNVCSHRYVPVVCCWIRCHTQASTLFASQKHTVDDVYFFFRHHLGKGQNGLNSLSAIKDTEEIKLCQDGHAIFGWFWLLFL